MMISKEARSDFKNDVRRLLSNLINYSLYLKKTDKEQRKIVGRKFLNNMNGWLYRRKLNTKKVQSRDHHHLYEGILFPFSPDQSISSTLVSLFLSQDCASHSHGNHLFRDENASALPNGDRNHRVSWRS